MVRWPAGRRCRRSPAGRAGTPTHGMRRPPAGWTSWSRSVPSPVARPRELKRPGGQVLARRGTGRPDRQPAGAGLDERARPRLVGADLPIQIDRRQRGVHSSVLAAQGLGQRHADDGLGMLAGDRPRATAPATPSSRSAPIAARRASSSGAVSSGATGVPAWATIGPVSRPSSIRIKRDAGGAVAGQDRRRDRRRAAVSREKRRVEVERAFPDPEQGRRDDLAVVGEDDEVRLERQDLVDRRRITQFGGGQDRSGPELSRLSAPAAWRRMPASDLPAGAGAVTTPTSSTAGSCASARRAGLGERAAPDEHGADRTRLRPGLGHARAPVASRTSASSSSPPWTGSSSSIDSR